VLQLTSNRELTFAELRLAGAARVPNCADAAYLLARARFLEAIRGEASAARAAS
jgi:hypothetical protein